MVTNKYDGNARDADRSEQDLKDTREVVTLQARRPDNAAGNEYQKQQYGGSADQDGRHRSPNRVKSSLPDSKGERLLLLVQ